MEATVSASAQAALKKSATDYQLHGAASDSPEHYRAAILTAQHLTESEGLRFSRGQAGRLWFRYRAGA